MNAMKPLNKRDRRELAKQKLAANPVVEPVVDPVVEPVVDPVDDILAVIRGRLRPLKAPKPKPIDPLADVLAKLPEHRRAAIAPRLRGFRRAGAGGTSERFYVFGQSATSVIRWLGTQKLAFKAVRKALNENGGNGVSDTTIRCQLRYAVKGLGPKRAVTLTDDQQATLLAAAAG